MQTEQGCREVDEFLDRTLVLAEIVLDAADAMPEIPDWLERRVVCEVTDEVEFTNQHCAQAGQVEHCTALRSAAPALIPGPREDRELGFKPGNRDLLGLGGSHCAPLRGRSVCVRSALAQGTDTGGGSHSRSGVPSENA